MWCQTFLCGELRRDIQIWNRKILISIVSMGLSLFLFSKITICVKIKLSLKSSTEYHNSHSGTWPVFHISNKDTTAKLTSLQTTFVTVQLAILDTHVTILNIPNVTLISQTQLFTKDAMELIVKLTFTPSKVSIHASNSISPLKPQWVSSSSAEL